MSPLNLCSMSLLWFAANALFYHYFGGVNIVWWKPLKSIHWVYAHLGWGQTDEHCWSNNVGWLTKVEPFDIPSQQCENMCDQHDHTKFVCWFLSTFQPNKCMLVWHTPSTLFNRHYQTLLNTASWAVWPLPTTLYDQLWRHVRPTMFVNLTPALAYK